MLCCVKRNRKDRVILYLGYSKFGTAYLPNIAVFAAKRRICLAGVIYYEMQLGAIDATIDRINNKIVDKAKTVASAENAGKTVLCTGCGAKNTLTGEVGQKCEYCGALLSEI